ncbi:MAG: hypothetical protein SF182_09395 [Deltaproteobacteria bacterium]|nr:hypothetical protein [Deltaproteobacteria bacterium]
MSARRLAAALLLGLGLAVDAAHGAVSQEAPASLLVFPLVRVDASAGYDTQIQLANLGEAAQTLRCVYAPADLDPAARLGFHLRLAAGQPVAWAASLGSADLPDGVGDIPALPASGFTGTLRCAATLADGSTPTAADVLSGSAILLRRGEVPDAASYPAVGFAATGASADTAEVLVLGGPMAEYDACPAEIGLQPLLDATPLGLGADGVLQLESATTIAIATCSSTPIGGAQASVNISVTNEFGQTLSTAKSVRELLVSPLSRLDTSVPRNSIFYGPTSGSPSGNLRISGGSSGVLALALTSYVDPAAPTAPAHEAVVHAQPLGTRELPDLVDLSLPTPAPSCTGDCNGDGEVTINELITGVNIALGSAPLSQCPAFDANGDDNVAINELIAAVGAALEGC